MTHRILFVIGSLEMGGTQRHLVQVASALDRRRWEPAIYCLVEKGILARDLEVLGIPVHLAWLANARSLSSNSLPRRILRLFGIACSLIKELIFHRPFIVHFFLPENYAVGGLCARAVGCRNLVMSRRSLNNYQTRRPVLLHLERYLHRYMTRIVGNSRAVTAELLAEGVPEAKLRLIYNGVDFASFSPSPSKIDARQKLEIPPNAWTMILVANLIPYKGHADLLDALSRIKKRLPNPWRLLCVGADHGPRAELRAYARELDLDENVLWLGVRTDVAALLAAADLGLLVSHEEGFANVILEGMAAGLPMIVTNVGGNAEAVLDGETGLVVPARDPERLGAAILTLAADPALSATFGEAGRQRVQHHFALDACIRRYESLYSELLPAAADAVD